MTNNPEYKLGTKAREYFSLTIGIGWSIDINHAVYMIRKKLTN